MYDLLIYSSLLAFVVVALFMGGRALILSRSMHHSAKYLALYMIFMTMVNLQLWFVFVQPSNLYPEIIIYFLPYELLPGPLFLLFTVYFLGIETRWMSWRFLLFIPFIVFLAGYIYIKYVIWTTDIGHEEARKYYYSFFKWEEAITLFYGSAIGVLCFVLILRFEKRHRSKKYDSVVAHTRWIKRILGLGLGLSVLWAFTLLFDLVSVYRFGNYAYLPAWYGFLMYVLWIGYSGFWHSKILNQRFEIKRLYANSPLFDFVAEDQSSFYNTLPASTNTYYEQLLHLLDHDKLHLNANLNLRGVSSIMGISASYLSKIIRQHSGSHFSDLINTYRVETAKKMLLSPDFDKYNILSIGLEAGFNSKSAFYNAFSKSTGETPTQFRKQNRSL